MTENSIFLEVINKRADVGEPLILHASDIDNTVVATFHERKVSPAPFLSFMRERYIPIAGITSETIQHFVPRIASGEVPLFPVLCDCVGIYMWFLVRRPEGGPNDEERIALTGLAGEGYYYERYRQWEREAAGSTNYNRAEVVKAGSSFLEAFGEKDRSRPPELQWEMVVQRPDIEEEVKSTGRIPYGWDNKVSYYFWASNLEMVEEVREAAAKHFGQKVLVCEEMRFNATHLPAEATRRKYCLDILATTKADAVEYLSRLGNFSRTVVSGDGGNDAHMLTESADIGIIVGNAKPDLVNYMQNYFQAQRAESLGGGWWRVREKGKDKWFFQDQSSRVASESLLYAFTQLESRGYL